MTDEKKRGIRARILIGLFLGAAGASITLVLRKRKGRNIDTGRSKQVH